MDQDYRARVIKAIASYSKKRAKSPSSKKNSKPEATVVIAVRARFRQAGFFIQKIEAKGVWSNEAQRYMGGMADAGTADLLGCSPDGRFVAIECKAPGRVGTLKDHQRSYLMEIINRNGFAIVTDNADAALETWNLWRQTESAEQARKLLIDKLGGRVKPPPEDRAGERF